MTTDTEHSDKILKFNFPASVYDKLYKAKLNNEYVEITLYHKHLNIFGYDILHLNDGMIYTLNNLKSLKIILSPQQLRDLKYRIVYEDDLLYSVDFSNRIYYEIGNLKSMFSSDESNEKVRGIDMNIISHIYQQLGDELNKIKKQGSTEAKQI